MMMKISGIAMLGGLAVGLIAAPTAAAAPQDCSFTAVADTASSTWATARQYLDAHPGANQAVMGAIDNPRPDSESDVRAYFTANPHEYYELRDILAPIGDTQRQCDVNVLPTGLSQAYDKFMAG